MCVISPAKLNLGLRIVGRRDDGYHLLESLFWPLDFCDELEILPGSTLRVRTDWSETAPRREGSLPVEKENLVYKTGRALWGDSGSLEIQITKRIPLGAGLGGGSSNAAALLRYALSQGQISGDKAQALALTLGADVPFFLTPQPSWVEGVGEKKSPLSIAPELASLSFLLVFPPFAVPTPSAFKAYREKGAAFESAQGSLFSGGVNAQNLTAYFSVARNSLEPTVKERYPLIADILSRLSGVGSYSGLSGTGSTCYAVFSSWEQAKEKAQELDAFFRNISCSSVLARTYSGPRDGHSKETTWKSPK